MATINDIVKVCNIIPPIDSFCNFVETGTGMGDSVSYCLENGCPNIWSIEIHPEIYSQAVKRFKNKNNCVLINDNSVSALCKIVPELMNNTLFFLDAHFPGADFHYTDYSNIDEEIIRIPLTKELEIISTNRKLSDHKDVFVIDDLRIYEDGPYEMGNWEHRQQFGSNYGIDFIYDFLGHTHDIVKFFNYTGFIVAIPKEEGC